MAKETKKVAIYSLEQQDELSKLAVSIEDENPSLAIKMFKILRNVQVIDITFETPEVEFVETTQE